jgi:MFS family permease
MKAKKYFLSMVTVYMAYLTHGMQALIFSQNSVNFATKWGFDMSDPTSTAYAAGLAAVSTAVAWTGLGKFLSVWIGGEVSDRVGRKKLMIGGAILYIICFATMLTTTNATIAAFSGLVAGVATSGFWDASGYPAVQEAYPAAPGTALIMIKFFVALSSIFYPIIAVKTAAAGNWSINIIIPLVLSCVVLVLAVLAPFVYDDEKKAGSAGGADTDLVAQEIAAAKARQLVAPGKFTAFVTYFYAFLVMAVMYGAQQYTKAFGSYYCGLTDIQAASMTTLYQVGSIVAVAFWAVMMSKLKWHPLKVLIVDSVITAVSLLAVLLIHQVAIVYVAILVLGFGCAGGALQTGLSLVQEFVPGPKGRNTGIYYTFMGFASYSLPTIVGVLEKGAGSNVGVAYYYLMMLMLVFALVQVVATLYLIARYKKVFGNSPLAQ